MRVPHNVFVMLTLVAATYAGAVAASQQPSKSTKAKDTSQVLTLIGCIAPNPQQPGGYVLSDTEQAASYRLTGTNVREYAGRRVQLSGIAPKRLRIVGGLYPSPNVAAQGGAIDPVKAAMAAASGPASGGTAPLSEFRVRSVREISGTCPER
jgi:hypothetical protein